MAGLVEHVMINKLGDDLDDAITFVGGDTSEVHNIMQYPRVIREQLMAGKIDLNKSIILEGDSCVIIADAEGRDQYNTEYATGIKTGLNPGAYYIRLCTAVSDIEPVYIDLTPIFSDIEIGGLDIDEVVSRVISSNEIKVAIQNEVNKVLSKYALQSDLDEIEERVSALENWEMPESGLTEEEVNNIISNILSGYVKNESLEDIERRISEVESREDKVGISEEDAQKLIDESLVGYATDEELESKVDKKVYEAQYNTVSEKITSLEQVSNNVTEVLQPQLEIIEKTLEEKVDESIVVSIVNSRLDELADDDGIDINELNW